MPSGARNQRNFPIIVTTVATLLEEEENFHFKASKNSKFSKYSGSLSDDTPPPVLQRQKAAPVSPSKTFGKNRAKLKKTLKYGFSQTKPPCGICGWELPKVKSFPATASGHVWHHVYQENQERNKFFGCKFCSFQTGNEVVAKKHAHECHSVAIPVLGPLAYSDRRCEFAVVYRKIWRRCYPSLSEPEYLQSFSIEKLFLKRYGTTSSTFIAAAAAEKKMRIEIKENKQQESEDDELPLAELAEKYGSASSSSMSAVDSSQAPFLVNFEKPSLLPPISERLQLKQIADKLRVRAEKKAATQQTPGQLPHKFIIKDSMKKKLIDRPSDATTSTNYKQLMKHGNQQLRCALCPEVGVGPTQSKMKVQHHVWSHVARALDVDLYECRQCKIRCRNIYHHMRRTHNVASIFAIGGKFNDLRPEYAKEYRRFWAICFPGRDEQKTMKEYSLETLLRKANSWKN